MNENSAEDAGAARARQYGKSLVDGVVRYTSVSQLEKADSSSSNGCLRRWWFERKHGLKEPPTDATIRGTKCHAAVENYLLTGSKEFPSIVMAGAHMIPPPGDDLRIEWPIVNPDLGLESAVLRADGIPLVGFIDLIHARPENYGIETVDPDGTIKIVDWKFPGTLNNAKNGVELVHTLQMSGYFLYVHETLKDFVPVDRVRLNHGYMPVKGTPRLSTAMAHVDEARDTWKRADRIAVSMKQAAREEDQNNVEFNLNACRAYGKPCPASSVCKAKSQRPFASLGRTATERFLSSKSPGASPQMTATPINPGSLVAQLSQLTQAPAAVAAPTIVQAPVPAAAPVAAPVTQTTNSDVDAEVARLKKVEVLSKEPITLADFVNAIEAWGWGFPSTKGSAAGQMGQYRRQACTNRDNDVYLAGSGELAQHLISDINQLPTVLKEMPLIDKYFKEQQAAALAAQAATQAVQVMTVANQPLVAQTPIGLLSPETPASNPVLASKQPEPQVSPEEAAAKKEAEKAAKKAEKAAKKAAKEAEKAAAQPAITPVQVNAPVVQVTTDAPLPTMQPTPTAVVNVAPGANVMTIDPAALAQARAVIASTVPVAQTGSGETTSTRSPLPGQFGFFVDCQIAGIEVLDLTPILYDITSWMTQDAGVSIDFKGVKATDFRMQEQGKYSHGKWRGIVNGCLMALYERGLLKPGLYKLNGKMSEIAGSVLETLQLIAHLSGGFYIEGAR